MGILVRLIGSGVGLAAEAIASKKDRSRSRSPSAHTLSPQASASISRSVERSSSTNKGEKNHSKSREAAQDYEEPPPAYEQVVEVPEERAHELIADGKALPLDEKHGPSHQKGLHGDDSESEDSEGDETNWALDEAAEEIAAPRAEDPKLKHTMGAQVTIESYSAVVMATCPPLNHPTNPLQRPVIIPQRRPGARARGFVHAYAPDLADKGIYQETFMSFIETFHKASQASPMLNVVFVSAGVVGMVPEPVAMITATIIQFAAGAAIELQTRTRTHSFLDDINAKLFKPRGLYAMVMQYKPQGNRPVYAQQADMTSLISKRTAREGHTNIASTYAGQTYGPIEMPESAPLVFPALDEAAESQDAETANKLKRSMGFVTEYYDRRAQAAYVSFISHLSHLLLLTRHQLHKNPDQRLDVPRPDFATRISDPNHPAFRGSWLTLISGGKIPPKAERRNRKRDERIQAGFQPTRKQDRKAWKQKKKLMKQNVLYLMIVNLPSDPEIEAARVKVQHEAQST